MALPIFCYNNFADASSLYTPTFSGGSWSGTLPLTNLASPLLAKIARSSSASLANAQFEIDLKVVRGCRVFSIPKHTISQSGKIRIRGYTGAGGTGTNVYDTGWLDVWPVIYPSGTLPAWSPSFWTGKLSAEDASGYNIGFHHVASTAYVAQYWVFEIDDTANTAGYVDLARLFISDGWQPTIYVAEGMGLGWTTDTTMARSDGGVTFFNTRPTRRRFAFAFQGVPTDEALVNPFEMQRRNGVSGQLVFIYDPDDTAHMHRRAMLCTQRSLPAFQWPYLNWHTVPMELEEVL